MNLELSYHPWCFDGIQVHYHRRLFWPITSLHKPTLEWRGGREIIIVPTEFGKIQWSYSWSYQVGAATEWVYTPQLLYIHMYKIRKHMCEDLNLQVWSSYASSWAVKLHWLDDGYLTYPIQMPSLKHVCFGLLPKWLDVSYSYMLNFGILGVLLI
jgi:hypothetical protein